MNRFRFVGLATALYAVSALGLAAPLDIRVKVDPKALSGNFTGSVVVFLSKNNPNPRTGPNWFGPEPMVSARFRNAPTAKGFVLTPANVTTFPAKLPTLPDGEYYVQAVLDRNLGGRTVGESPGNVFSKAQRITLSPSSGPLELTVDQVVPEPEFKDTASVKGVEFESKLLSKFYGRPTSLKAVVILPEAYDAEATRTFPAIYDIPGFGGSWMNYSGRNTRGGTLRDGEPFVRIFLDADCPTGHSVFADSDNNGPWGRALTTELIPYLESKYRLIAKTGARLVTGHSSGGWSSLWLQVTYPEVFGGVWSTSPDPVDFRDFQRINIYEHANMFTAPDGSVRPLARVGERIMATYRGFSDMERPLRGEQLGSFDGVFSKRGRDGEPQPLWNRETGAIDRKVAEDWKRYDIGLILRTNWTKLEPKLRGKLHIYMGNEDTFFLEGAVKLLQADMKALGSDAKIEIFPGDHGSVLTAALRKRIDEEMAAQFRTWQKRPG